MRTPRIPILALALALPCAAASASEAGSTIRAGDLYAQPFIDAAKAGQLPANQPVTIVERRGGWLSIDAGGKRGWMRLLNVRLNAAVASGAGQQQSIARMRTGSTGRTVATGVKGLDEADIRNASVDPVQLEKLDGLAASDADARQLAQANGLRENDVAYLKPGKGS